MKRVKIAELKNHLSQHLRSVEGGDQIVVTDRDRPIARNVPMGSSGAVVRMMAAKRAFSSVRAKRCVPARWRVRSLALLLEERRDR